MNLDCPRTNEEFRELAHMVAGISARCWMNLRPGSFAENYWNRINSNALTLWRIADDTCQTHPPEGDYRDLRDERRRGNEDVLQGGPEEGGGDVVDDVRHPADDGPGRVSLVDERTHARGRPINRQGLA